MQYKEDQFTCADGDQLFFRNWIPPEAPLAVLIIIHGFSDHSGRYQSIVVNLVPRRIAIYSFDQRSHGRSPGQHGHIDSFSMDAGIDNTGLSRDPDVVQTFFDDPLCHSKGTPRLATELSKAVTETNTNAPGFQPPLLITHGTAIARPIRKPAGAFTKKLLPLTKHLLPTKEVITKGIMISTASAL
jgi:alpha-beta hydrolase superfamily lysophospholipase